MSEDFYKNKAWELIMERLDSMDKKIDQQGEDIAYVKSKLVWVFAFAGGIAFAFSLLWTIGKDYIVSLIKKA